MVVALDPCRSDIVHVVHARGKLRSSTLFFHSPNILIELTNTRRPTVTL